MAFKEEGEVIYTEINGKKVPVVKIILLQLILFPFNVSKPFILLLEKINFVTGSEKMLKLQ